MEKENKSSRGRRHPESLTAWNVLHILACAAWVTVMVTKVARDYANDDGANISFIAAVGIGTVLAVTGFLLVVGNAQTRRVVALKQRFPDALVVPMARSDMTNRALADAGYPGVKLGHYFVLIAQHGRIEFWRSPSADSPKLKIPESAITGFGVGPSPMGNAAHIASLFLLRVARVNADGVADDPSKRYVPMAPSRIGWLGAFPLYSSKKVLAVAESLNARMEADTQRTLPEVQWFTLS